MKPENLKICQVYLEFNLTSCSNFNSFQPNFLKLNLEYCFALITFIVNQKKPNGIPIWNIPCEEAMLCC